MPTPPVPRKPRAGTRMKILETSLDLFSQRGYEAVSVRDIAAAVGLRESSLYNHFRNKREIFDTLVELCWQKAQDYFSSHGLPFSMKDDLSPLSEPDFSKLSGTVLEIFRYFFEDPWNLRFRRLLVVSQYNDPRAGELYQKLFCRYPLAFQTELFSRLMQSGRFQPGDPEAAALEFYGGVFLLLHTCENWAQAEPKLLAHLKQFQDRWESPAETKEDAL